MYIFVIYHSNRGYVGIYQVYHELHIILTLFYTYSELYICLCKPYSVNFNFFQYWFFFDINTDFLFVSFLLLLPLHAVCVHGTYKRNLESILTSGLKRMKRLHVHFSRGLPTDGEVISGNVIYYLKESYFALETSKSGYILFHYA